VLAGKSPVFAENRGLPGGFRFTLETMEPYDSRRESRRDEPGGLLPQGWSPAMIPGLILVAIGALFLLGNLHILRVTAWIAYWPLILIAAGLFKLVDSTHSGGRIAGAVLTGVGCVYLAANLGYITFAVEDLWPLILIGIGVVLLWTRTHPGADTWWDRARARRRWRMEQFAGNPSYRGNLVHEYAIFGGSRRVVTDQDFKGGRIDCVFGGTYLDLSAAAMTGDTAVLVVSTVYGGATVRIPTNWNLEVHGAGVFGGFVDHTVHPSATPDMKHLIVRGASVFGGVTFKN
jgi:predicted membrane protein